MITVPPRLTLLLGFSLLLTEAETLDKIHNDSNSSPLLCSIGFGKEMDRVVVPPDRINDGYCDCPVDGGLDELETGACSGSLDGGWAGLHQTDSNSQSFNDYFQCPQQSNLSLPPSRINDGICDCCEGADEYFFSCSDICDELLLEERAARQKMLDDYRVGSKARQKDMETYDFFYKETVAQIDTLDKQEIPKLEEESMLWAGKVDSAKRDVMKQRSLKIKEVFEPISKLLPGSLDQLKTFIASACHIFEETSRSNSNNRKWRESNTCIPLRLAGLDLGILWEKENLKTKYATVKYDGWTDDVLSVEIANILITNAADQTEMWSVGTDDDIVYAKRNEDDDSPYDDPDDEFINHYDDDDMIEDEEDIEDHNSADDTDVDNSTQMIEHTSPISLLRTPFYNEAKKLKGRIYDIENAEDGSGDNSDNKLHIDPIATQMVTSYLSLQMLSIEHGRVSAESAHVLLNALEESSNGDEEKFKYQLLNLAVGTIYHGNLSAADVVEIVALYDVDFQDNSCFSIYTSICPATTKKMTNIYDTLTDFPGSDLIEYVSERCAKREKTVHVCNSEEGDVDTIPSSIPDGYFGFYKPKPRDQNDFFSLAFESLENRSLAEIDAQDIESTKISITNDLGKKVKEKAGLIKSIWNRENREDPKYGTDGELYGLRDECFQILAGKYTYEVCIFGKAYQREGNAEKGGTNLGTWEGMQIDKRTGLRTMRWINGAKCWNGPKRSASVSITCGARSKLLSADEPNTCEYVFEMESHIACDEKFAQNYLG